MSKMILNRPALILMYGFPGAGKTYLSRQLCTDLQAAHVQGDRLRYELFEQPRYDKQENQIVEHLMDYMAEEFLKAGISVVYDTHLIRYSQRRQIRELAKRNKAESLLVWLQIDKASAYARASKRDRRRIDDKYSSSLDESEFDRLAGYMQNPQPTEDYLVISGKHTYNTQKNAIFKRLFDIGLTMPSDNTHNVVKPGLVNLIPNINGGRVDSSRRNINIR